MPKKYLDENGNPVATPASNGPTYLDEGGSPLSPSTPQQPDLARLKAGIASPAGGANYPQPSGFQSVLAKIGNSVFANPNPSPSGLLSTVGNWGKQAYNYGLTEAAKGGQAISEQTYPPNVVQGLQDYGNKIGAGYNKGFFSGLGATLQGVNPANLIDTQSPGKTLGNVTLAGIMAKALPEGKAMKAEIDPNFAADRLTNITGTAPPGKPSSVGMIRNALPEIIDTIKTTGVKDWPTAIQGTLSKLEARYQGYLNPIKDQTVSGETIAQAIESKITSDMPQDLQNAIHNEANQYRSKVKGSMVDSPDGPQQLYQPRQYSLEELDNIRKRLNADNEAYHNKQDISQGAERHKSNAGKLADLTAESAARDVLYQNLENHWGSVADIRGLKNTQGDLMQLKQRATNRAGNVEDIAAAQRGMSLPQKIQNAIRGYLGTRSAGMHVSAGEVIPPSATDLHAIQNAGQKLFTPKTTAVPDTGVSSLLLSGAQRKPQGTGQ